MTNIYQIDIKTNAGNIENLSKYKGKVLLIVNTASACGFTPQYAGLQALYQEFNDTGFEVLAFPCNQFGKQEKGEDLEIRQFCDLQFNIKFPLYCKVDVNGDSAHPLFSHLKEKAPGILGTKSIKWNFTKFLVDKSGNVVKRFSPKTKPEQIKRDIEALL